MYRCLNNLFAYCSDKPQFTEPEKELGLRVGNIEIQPTFPAGNRCLNNTSTCPHHQTFTQSLAINKVASSKIRPVSRQEG